MKELRQANVYIKDKENVTEKVKSLVKGGASSLQIISDFDMTLTRYLVNGKRCPSSHGILNSSIKMSPTVEMEQAAVYTKYRAIELDKQMSVEEKIPYMAEWWEKTYGKFTGNSSITKSGMKKAVSQSNSTLKDGVPELFDYLHKHSIPLLLLSAGIGDVIEEIIKQQATFHPNMNILSNFMKFESEENMIGFIPPWIHTFNKNEGSLGHSAYFEEINHRHNIILLGDMMEDLNMAHGIENMNTILKIGYLNNPTPSSLETYKEAWDVVIADEPTVHLLNSIVSKIIAGF